VEGMCGLGRGVVRGAFESGIRVTI
jgi:hypothetical protein